ncbi:autotransporter outer membrane beta-barrel domain-containing protein [Paraburkholderia sp. Ac-20340]|nr:autotransporter outer membrane beta-barrel domain-containing protein [Paraburkholderia sp. Ac-20340]
MLAVAGTVAFSSGAARAAGGNGLSYLGAGVGGTGGTDGTLATATGQVGTAGTISTNAGSGGGGALDLTTGNGAAGGARATYGTGVVLGTAGATGTVGMVVTTTTSISGTVTGGTGATGQAAVENVNTQGGSGGGGAGVQATADVTVTATGTVTGGMGGILTGGGGGGGGAGIFSTANVTVDAGGKVTGGAGNTTLSGGSGGGGQGGAAIALSGSGTVTNSGTLTGGTGERSITGAGGDGGAGVEVVSGGTVINEAGGTITGGTGGQSSSSHPSTGGAGITGTNVTVINAGTITRGAAATGGKKGNAIEFTGGVNSLEIWSTSVITGNVVAYSAADTFKLGGSTNSSFDVSQIGSSAQYQGFGVFEKVGTSTWTLTGTTSAVTPWTMSEGILQISDDANLGDASGGLTFNGGTLENTADVTSARSVTMQANGTLLTDAATTLTLNGTITGNGVLTKDGTGTLVLDGDDTYTGGTTISAGTLQIGSGGTSGSIVGDVANNGTLLLDRAGTLTLDGTISGTGSVSQLGSGTAVLAANNTYTGGTTIASGTLQLGNGGTSGSVAGNIVDNGTLAFDRSDAFTLDGLISGTGAVNQLGSGTTILTAANTYTGDTNVLAGTLAIGDAAHTNASIASALTNVDAGATLGGYGTVSGSVDNSGTVSVADALAAFATAGTGSLTIGGDLTNDGVINLAAASGSIGNVLDVAGNYSATNGLLVMNTLLNAGGTATQTDRLVVGGNASGTTAITVNGSGSGALTTGDGIEIVQVNGTSAANSFHLATAVQAGAYQYLLYQGSTSDANSWYLRSRLAAAQTASSGSADSAAASSASASALAPVAYRPAVVGYSVTPLLNADYGFSILGRLHERVGDVANLDASQPAHSNGVWGRLGGQNLDADAGDRFSADEHTFFAEFGKDWTLSRGTNGGSTHAGATVTIGSTSANFADSARSIAAMSVATGSVETQAQSIGGYWTKFLPDGTYFDGVGQLTHYHNRFGDVYGGSASQNGFGAGASGEVGKPFALGSTGVAIEPQAQLLYQYLHLNGFDDGIAPVGSNTTNALRGRLGVRLFKANLSNDSKTSSVTPYFTADVLHDFFSPGQTTVGGTPFDNAMQKTWYDVGVGITGNFGKHSAVYANVKYERNIGGDYRRNVFGQAGYRFSW